MTETLTPVLTLIAAISAAHHGAQRLVEARLPKGLGAAQFAVMERLIRLGEGQTPRAIAAVFGWPKTSMSHTLAVMEARGLVRLEPNPRDGRSKCLWLTPKGRTLAMLAVTAVERDMARIAGLAPVEAVEALAVDLASLADRLEDQRRFPDVA